MDTSHVFLQGVLAVFPLIGRVVALEGLKPVLGMKWDFLFALWLLPFCQGRGLLPR